MGLDDETRHATAIACVDALRGGSDEAARQAFEAAVKRCNGGDAQSSNGVSKWP
jgi:hypothetical protein